MSKHFHIKIQNEHLSTQVFPSFAWALARCAIWAMDDGNVGDYKPVACEVKHDPFQTQTTRSRSELRASTDGEQSASEGQLGTTQHRPCGGLTTADRGNVGRVGRC
jgi:hypothetical protein